jgi:hypothetical protein
MRFRLAPVMVAVTSRIRQPPILSISVIRLAIGLPRFRTRPNATSTSTSMSGRGNAERLLTLQRPTTRCKGFAEPAAQWEASCRLWKQVACCAKRKPWADTYP